MQNQKVIERLGYSPKEAKVYLASLMLGEAHISDIAHKVDMPRSTVQTIAERLHEDGLMNFYVMRRYKYWVAEDPNQLLSTLKEREEMVEEAIPNLVALKQKARQRIKDFKQLEDLTPLKNVADGMHQPVLVANSDTEIRYVNEAWQTLFGHELDEMIGHPTTVLRSGKTPPAEYERLWRTLRADKLFESDSIIDQKKDGTTFTLFTIIFPVTYGNRKFYVQILEDRPKQNDEVHAIKKEFTEAIKE
jgi:PAS domain S-box-containing protein